MTDRTTGPEFRFQDTKKIVSPDFLTSTAGGHEVDLRETNLDTYPGEYNEEGGYLESPEDANGFLVALPVDLEQNKDYTVRVDWGYSELPQYDAGITTVKSDLVWENRSYSDIGVLKRHPVGRKVSYIRFGHGVTDPGQWDYAFDEGDRRLVLDFGKVRLYSVHLFEGEHSEVFKANGVPVESDGTRVGFPSGLDVRGSRLANLVPQGAEVYTRYAENGPTDLFTQYENQTSAAQLAKYTMMPAPVVPNWLSLPTYPGASLEITEPGVYAVDFSLSYGGSVDTSRLLSVLLQVHNTRNFQLVPARSGGFAALYSNIIVFPEDFEDMNQGLRIELAWVASGGAPTTAVAPPAQTTFSITQTHKIVL